MGDRSGCADSCIDRYGEVAGTGLLGRALMELRKDFSEGRGKNIERSLTSDAEHS